MGEGGSWCPICLLADGALLFKGNGNGNQDLIITYTH